MNAIIEECVRLDEYTEYEPTVYGVEARWREIFLHVCCSLGFNKLAAEILWG